MTPVSTSYFQHPACFIRIVLGILLFLLVSPTSFAQSISGYITDENNEPVPFANVFVRELNTGTSADEKGYYFMTIDVGVYQFIYSSVGYQAKTEQVIISDKPLKLNIRLRSEGTQLNEIVVKATKRDPAFEIIKHVIDNKEKFLSQIKSARAGVYVRAMETVDDKKKKPREVEEENLDLSKGVTPSDDLAEAKKKEEEEMDKINMVEMQLTLNYLYPDQYKEERTGYKTYGKKEGLFIPLFGESDFNFYHNLVHLKGIAEVPLISPVSKFSFLSYKYKLEEMVKEESGFVYKIKVTPRKTGDATCRGYLYINDSTWHINRLELTLDKGGLKFYDVFTIRQTYKEIAEDVWIPYRQEFDYQTKGGSKVFKGNTVWMYASYEKDYVFPAKFFGNEVAVTTKEAYTRDSTYWKKARTEPLTEEQQKVVSYRDSITAAHSTQAYIDSIEAKFNKITFGEVLYHGIGFRKEATKRNIYISPLLSLIGFEVIGGFRIGPYVSYFRRFDNGRALHTSGSFSMGFKNRDWTGNVGFWTRYNPLRLGDISVRVGRDFYSVNSFDAYLNQLRISNYILHEHASVFHRIELFNGFYVSAELGFHNRLPVTGYDRTSIINRVIDEDAPLEFTSYQALISQVKLSYTPGQRFMTEPTQKVVLGSKYPTFSLAHRKGWNQVLTSDINFDYLEASIEQNLLLGTLGNSRYTLSAGKFVNTADLRYVDLKRFRQSDPYLYSDPLHSFQLLDTSMSATDLFLEAHYIHHFNGAMINNIPLIKKTKIRTVAGAGAMWIKQSNYRYQEVFGGVERVFKMGPRRRLRLGVFGVISQTNHLPPRTGFKVSFDVIDSWKREWSY